MTVPYLFGNEVGAIRRDYLDADFSFLAAASGAINSIYSYMSAAQIADAQGYGFSFDLTTILAQAVSALPASGGLIYFPPGGYLGSLSIRRSNVIVSGAGYAITTLRQPAGALSPGGVVEFGNTALGNGAPAFSNLALFDITLDGNLANITPSGDDIHGHGCILTNCSRWLIDRVRALNCYNGGLVPVINSDYGFLRGVAEGCGNTTTGIPGIDINSSHHVTTDAISLNCVYGCRVLDNCWGNKFRVAVYNAGQHGFIHQNQTGNESYNNHIDVSVSTCGVHGAIMGEGVRDSFIRVAVDSAGADGIIVNDASSAAVRVSDCDLHLSTRNSQNNGILYYGNRNRVIARSKNDGKAGPAGTYYAIDITGDSMSSFDTSVVDGNSLVRSVLVRNTSSDTRFGSHVESGVVSGFVDQGVRTRRPLPIVASPQSCASAAALVLPSQLGRFFLVTGVVNITSISTTASIEDGAVIVLQFAGILTVTNGNNLRLVGNYTTIANGTLVLQWDGSVFNELSRSAI